MDVLRSLPCLAAAPEELLLWIRAYGELRSYQPGQCIIPRRVRGTFYGLQQRVWLMCILAVCFWQEKVCLVECDVRSLYRPLQPVDDDSCVSCIDCSATAPRACSSCCLGWCVSTSSGLAGASRGALSAWAGAWALCRASSGATCLALAWWQHTARWVGSCYLMQHGFCWDLLGFVEI
jgi:hypothetical protein